MKLTNDVWQQNIQKLLLTGVARYPRGKATLEVLNNTSVIDMKFPVLTLPGRGMGYRFLFGEALWILQGRNDVQGIARYAPAIRDFSDDGYHFQGAYGPKVTEQLNYIVDTMTHDKHSRQAVISIWREQPRLSKDIPCTLTLQFFIRDEELHCVANMRSSDIWLGWVYDVFNFSMISAWIAIRLRENTESGVLRLGNLYLNAASQHLYDKNKQDATLCLQDVKSWLYCPLDLTQYNDPMSLLEHLTYLRDRCWVMCDAKKWTFMKELRTHVT